MCLSAPAAPAKQAASELANAHICQRQIFLPAPEGVSGVYIMH